MPRIYVASRVARASMWRDLRAAGVPIISTWIDEAGEGETDDFAKLWERIDTEIRQCDYFWFYGDRDDAPWKGALVEVGMALAYSSSQVYAIIPKGLDGRLMRPVGSWLHHPDVTIVESIAQARIECQV